MRRREWLLAASGAAALLTGCRAATTDGGAETGTRATAYVPGLQLYTVRELLARDVPGTLGEVARIGYREVELAGLHGLFPTAFRRHLDDAGLSAPSAHVPIEALRSDLERSLADAETLGVRTLVVPWLDPAERTAEGYRRVAADLDAAGRRARERGVAVAFHNQAYDLDPLSGRTGWDLLLDGTDAAVVSMQMDVYWAVAGGADPLSVLREHPARFVSLHAKDRTPEGAMVAVGEGTIDFASLLAAAPALGVRRVFVEHDEPADPLTSIRTSYRTLTALEA